MTMRVEMRGEMRAVQEYTRVPLLDHLKSSSSQYEACRESGVKYLANPRGNKFFIVAGRTSEGKTRLATELVIDILNDPRVLECQRNNDFMYEPDYSNIGQHIEAGARIGLVKHKKGSYVTSEYDSSSKNTANLMRLSLGVPRLRQNPHKRRIVHFYDTVGLTGLYYKGELIGVNRGLDWAKEIALQGAISIVMFAEGDWQKQLELREKIKKAKLREIAGILAENRIIDNRSPKDIRQFYRESGSFATRDQQDGDIRYVMTKLIFMGELQPPDFEVKSPLSFRLHPQQAEEYIRNVYVPYWLKMLYEKDDPEQAFIIDNRMLPSLSEVEGHKVVNAYGEQLEKHSLLPIGNHPGKLDLLTRSERPQVFHLRAALGELGAFRKRTYRRKAA